VRGHRGRAPASAEVMRFCVLVIFIVMSCRGYIVGPAQPAVQTGGVYKHPTAPHTGRTRSSAWK
jgi:hypothetical protein